MGRMPARMYRRITQQAYTRRKYIGGVPGLRIQSFELGNKAGDFPAVLHLVADERCQVRHTALEAARIVSNRVLAKNCGSLGYHLKIRVYPHHVLRHNKQAAGAGADRISSGMRGAFGKPVGTAARVDVGQEILTIRTHWQFLEFAKDALRRASMKLPTPCTVKIVGEIPKNIEELEEEAKAIGSTEVGPSPTAEPDEAVAEEGEEAEEGDEGEEGDEDEEEGGIKVQGRQPSADDE